MYKSTFIIFISLLLSFSVQAKVLQLKGLTCEYQKYPISVASPTPQFGWQFVSDEKDLVQTAYAIEIFSYVNGNQKMIWESGKVKSNKSQLVRLQNKGILKYGCKYSWRVKVWDNKGRTSEWSEVNYFRMAPNDIESGAYWIGAIDIKDSNIPTGRNYHGLSITSEEGLKWQQTDSLSKRSICLRKEFSSIKEIEDAIIYVSGLGHYELSMNGEKIGDSQFNPMWSDYDKTVYYNAYEVTHLMNDRNTIGVLLGNGFFNEQGGRYSKFQVSFGPPTLFFKMILSFKDGSKEEIVSGNDWKYSESPIIYNDMFGGEDYDARLEMEGWDDINYNDSDWKNVIVQTPPKGLLSPQNAGPVKIMESYSVQNIKRVGSSYVFDMGQNLSGYPKIKVKGKEGDKIRLTVGENINSDGTVNQSQSGAPHYYEYTLKGGVEEIWHPRFSYYGFRYIQVDGAKPLESDDSRVLPVISDLNSCFVYNSAPQKGSFNSSNKIFNDAHRIIVNAIKSNMHAVFTDCPHREKLGWLEEVHLNGPGLLFNFDLSSFAPKIMQDIKDAQLPNGLVPDIAPEYVVFDGGFRDSPEWGSTSVILPFMYYEYYGDNSLIIKYYDVMKRYVDYLSSTASENIVSHGLGDWYDFNVDFPAGPSRNTPIPLSATMHYYMDIVYLIKAAELLNKVEDVAFYSNLRDKVKASYNKKFFNVVNKQYGTGSQASNAMSLFIDVVPEDYKKDVLNNLINNIVENGYKLTTGDVGNRYLFQVLAKNNLNDIMYKMHNHNEVPGYGFQIQFGATTLTEQWDPRNGNSWNHFMMGQIEEWFYKSLAGIQSDNYSGYQNFIIAPKPVGDLKFIDASFETLYGKIVSKWVIDNNKFTLQVSVPPNCNAKVYLPGEDVYKVIGSGDYTFIKEL